MKDDDRKHLRRSIRLHGYDYAAAGGYFIIVVAFRRNCVFMEIGEGTIWLNALGEIVREEWFKTARLRLYVELREEEFVIMPNHVHGIVWIADDFVGARRRRAPTEEHYGKPVAGSIPTIICAFKSAVSYRANHELNIVKIWHRNYYEHIIRNDVDYKHIANHIATNPENWGDDEENPRNIVAKENR